MRHLQVIEARDMDEARRSYLELLSRRGVALPHGTQIYVETVHRPRTAGESWLCYLAQPGHAAA